MKNLFVRAASGLVFVALMAAGILINEYGFLALITLILIGSLNEYFNITATKREAGASRFGRKGFLIGMFVVVYLVSFVLASTPMRAFPDINNLFKAFFHVILMQRDSALTMNAIIPCMVFVLFIIELFNRTENPFANIGWNLTAVFYLLVPMVLTNQLYFNRGGVFLMTIFAIIWLFDSASYAFGSVLGKHPLFTRVSPKKTIEGLLGGAAVTLVFAYFIVTLSKIWQIPGLDFLTQWQWVFLSFVIIVAATFGDLVESLLKRSLNIKDSGSIMPGHGGFLDRFDAYFLTVPFVLLSLWLINQLNGILLLIGYMSQ